MAAKKEAKTSTKKTTKKATAKKTTKPAAKKTATTAKKVAKKPAAKPAAKKEVIQVETKKTIADIYNTNVSILLVMVVEAMILLLGYLIIMSAA